MTNSDVYKGAVSLLGEQPSTAQASYESRAVAILPIVARALLPIDRLYKRAADRCPISLEGASFALADKWPLEECLFACAAHYLASELCAFEDENLSTVLFVRAEALRRSISELIPFEIKHIR